MLSSSAAVASSPLPEQSAISPAPTNTTEPLAATTVMVAVPDWPSLVAVMVAEPTVAPLTRPLGLTVATVVLPLAHATARPDSGLPLPSFGVAVSWTVLPSLTDADAGVTATEATGTNVTVMAEVPLFPSDVAVIVADPAPTPVTRPLPVTLATPVLLLDQLTVRPDNGAPFASFGVASSCTVPPTVTLAVAGATSTVATDTGGVVPVIAKLQTVCVPASEYTVELARLATVACSVRKA